MVGPVIDGARLQERMTALGYSQASLGRAVRVSQQAIGKLVNGASQGSTKIARIARVLETTPAYLEGEVDDPELERPDFPSPAGAERTFLERLRQLTPAQRKLIQGMMDELVGDRRDRPTLHAPTPGYRGEEAAR